MKAALQVQPKSYCYTFIRQDLPLEQKIVQAAHATFEAGLKAGHTGIKFDETTSLVLLEVHNEEQLLKAYQHVTTSGIDCALFYEPDDNLGYSPSHTAFATLPITQEHRHHFKKYRLFKSQTKGE